MSSFDRNQGNRSGRKKLPIAEREGWREKRMKERGWKRERERESVKKERSPTGRKE